MYRFLCLVRVRVLFSLSVAACLALPVGVARAQQLGFNLAQPTQTAPAGTSVIFQGSIFNNSGADLEASDLFLDFSSFDPGAIAPVQLLGSTSVVIPAGTQSSIIDFFSLDLALTAVPGTYQINITLQNAAAEVSDPISATITIVQPLPAVNSAAVTAKRGQPFRYQIVASSDPEAYQADNLPTGLKINQKTGLITGTPTTAGKFAVKLLAFNTSGIGNGVLTLTIADTPVVTFQIPGADGGNKGQVLEGHTLKIRVVRSGGVLSEALTVRYKTKGANVEGEDYNFLTGIVTIPAGATFKKIKVRALEDGVIDGNKTLKLKFIPSDDASYVLGTPQQAKIRIIDADAPDAQPEVEQ